MVRRIHPPSGDTPTTPVSLATLRRTRPCPDRSRGLASRLPWAVVAVAAVAVLVAVSAWSACARGPESTPTAARLATPPRPTVVAAGPVSQVAAADNPIVVAPRPTVARGAAPIVPKQRTRSVPSAPAAETVPVAAPSPVPDMVMTSDERGVGSAAEASKRACADPAGTVRPPTVCPATTPGSPPDLPEVGKPAGG